MGTSVATILLIDDDLELPEMNRLVLAHRGHEVWSACSAREAREILKKGRPDIVVLDVMSVSAGIELAREIHRQFPDLPIVVLSGGPQGIGSPFGVKPGEDWLPIVRFLDKPVAPEVLADRIEDMLAK